VWRTDFADPAALARLRAKIMMATTAGALLSMVGSWVTHGPVWTTAQVASFAGGGAFMALVGLFIWRRGEQMGDVPFAVLVYSGYPVTAATLVVSDAPAAIPMVALCSMITTTIAVLFIRRSAIAYAGVGLDVVTVSVVTMVVRPGSRTMIEYFTSVLCLLMIGVTMRLVRDLAISALVRSRRVEATDALTQLLNRRGLERAGAVAWERAARAGLPLSAMVLDVDHFKRINDELGHAAGDEVLRGLGALLSDRTREEDVVARLGGEEFLVLSTCVPDNVDVFAERLRRTVEVELGTVTVSIGVHTEPATLGAAWPEAVWAMVNRADHALYRAKEAGRNRVVKTVDPQLAALAALPGQRAASPSPEGGRRLSADATPGRRLTDGGLDGSAS